MFSPEDYLCCFLGEMQETSRDDAISKGVCVW